MKKDELYHRVCEEYHTFTLTDINLAIEFCIPYMIVPHDGDVGLDLYGLSELEIVKSVANSHMSLYGFRQRTSLPNY